MKVLHVINSLQTGGAERLLSDLVPALSRKGITCEVYALDRGRDSFSAVLKAAGIRVRFAPDRKGGPYSPLHVFDIAREIRRWQPDVVHAHLAPTLHMCGLLSLFLRKPRYIVTEHASENRRMKMPALRGLEEFFYGRYRTIAAVSRECAEVLEKWLLIPASKFAVAENGLPLKRFSSVTEPAADVEEALKGRIGVCMVARLVPVKDHMTALRAMSRLPENYCLILAGDGPEKDEILRQSWSLDLRDRVFLLGSRSDVPAVLAACSIYLQTSKIEGFGIAALEAMAAGLPVVASEAVGLGELVKDAGLTFPVGNDASCAVDILRIESQPALAERLAVLGHERAARYSIERCAERYVQLYEKILAA